MRTGGGRFTHKLALDPIRLIGWSLYGSNLSAQTSLRPSVHTQVISVDGGVLVTCSEGSPPHRKSSATHNNTSPPRTKSSATRINSSPPHRKSSATRSNSSLLHRKSSATCSASPLSRRNPSPSCRMSSVTQQCHTQAKTGSASHINPKGARRKSFPIEALQRAPFGLPLSNARRKA